MSNTQTDLIFTPERDKYGRSCQRLTAYPSMRTLGYVVRLPKAAIEHYGDGNKYFINDWTREDDGSRRFTTLKAAKAALTGSVQVPA